MVRNLKSVTKAAGDTEKAISKVQNKADSNGNGGFSGIVAINRFGGATKMVGNMAQEAANAPRQRLW